MKKVKNNDITTLNDLITQQHGELGTESRDTFEKGYEAFKLGALIQEARLRKGFTQEQLANKVGMNKAYISKVENNVKDIRFSTLQKIVDGLGGHLNFSIDAMPLTFNNNKGYSVEIANNFISVSKSEKLKKRAQ
jgi:HTH-type transcriptional regulator / antitoxin HipB